MVSQQDGAGGTASDGFSCGLVGLGNMGRGLAKNLCEKLPTPIVFDVNPDAMTDAGQRGAKIAGSLPELIAATSIVGLCLPSIRSIESVYEGPDGLLHHAREGQLVVDFSTGNPELTRRYGEALAEIGVTLIDTPMLRNVKAAWEGNLHLIVSGSSAGIDRAKAVLDAVSEYQYHAGDLGAAQTIKLINNAVTIANGAILCEAFTIGRKMNVDLSLLHDVMDVSFAGSKKLPDISRRLIEDDHKAAFSTDVSLKDISLFTTLSSELGALTPIADSTRDLLRLTSAWGYGGDHGTRVATVLAKVIGTSFSSGERGVER